MPNDIVLGFDFGMKRIGVAVGNKIVLQATALSTLRAIDGVPKWEEVAALMKEWRPACLLVGIPLNIDGSVQLITHAARSFAKKLSKQTGLSVLEVDERLTTVEARSQLFEAGGFRHMRKKDIDSAAAKLITEQWLHSQS